MPEHTYDCVRRSTVRNGRVESSIVSAKPACPAVHQWRGAHLARHGGFDFVPIAVQTARLSGRTRRASCRCSVTWWLLATRVTPRRPWCDARWRICHVICAAANAGVYAGSVSRLLRMAGSAVGEVVTMDE